MAGLVRCAEGRATGVIGERPARLRVRSTSNRDRAVAYGRRGEVFWKTGQIGEAEKDCNQALKLHQNPDDPKAEGEVYRLLGNIAFSRSDMDAGENFSELL